MPSLKVVGTTATLAVAVAGAPGWVTAGPLTFVPTTTGVST